MRNLKLGCEGDDVAALQRELRAVGLMEFFGEPNGVYDAEVEAAVLELQTRLGVHVDGIYGRETEGAYLAAVQSGELTPFYVETLPLYGCVIGLDPGHQSEADLTLEAISPGSPFMRYSMTEGCFGVRTNINESVINLDVSMLTGKLLEAAGARVIMTRVEEDVSLSNQARAELMNEENVDFWIRIHCDSSSDASLNGARVLVPNGIANFNIASESAVLGNAVIENFCAVTESEMLLTRALTSETGFNWSNVPVVVLELGYLSNAASDLALSRPAYRQLCAEGLLCGIAEYYFVCGAIDGGEYYSLVCDILSEIPVYLADRCTSGITPHKVYSSDNAIR